MWGSCRSVVNGGKEKPPVVIGVNAVNEGSMWVSRCLIINTKGGYKGNEYSETRAACGDHAAPL